MAIFVSNPPSAAVPTLSSDALDPSALAPEEGFTEELAAAMQPSVAPIEAPAKLLLDNLQEVGKKASDLQILPAEVLKNAVGECKFCLCGSDQCFFFNGSRFCSQHGFGRCRRST